MEKPLPPTLTCTVSSTASVGVSSTRLKSMTQRAGSIVTSTASGSEERAKSASVKEMQKSSPSLDTTPWSHRTPDRWYFLREASTLYVTSTSTEPPLISGPSGGVSRTTASSSTFPASSTTLQVTRAGRILTTNSRGTPILARDTENSEGPAKA